MRKGDTPLLEWTMGAVGALIFAILFGVTTWSAIVGADGPPLMVAEVRDVVETAQGHLVEFEVRNSGDTSAADAKLTAELRVGGLTIEAHTLTFDYLPRHATRRGGFVFEHDPRMGEVKLMAEGYVDP